jgi:hypothetical protein
MLIHKLQEGDVVYTNCIGNELCYHLGIVYEHNGEKYIFHNAPTNNNKYGGTIVKEHFKDFTKSREIYKVVRTNVKNEKILRVSQKYKTEVWDTFYFNCEDFIAEIVEGERNSDLRDVYKIAALTFLLIVLT